MIAHGFKCNRQTIRRKPYLLLEASLSCPGRFADTCGPFAMDLLVNYLRATLIYSRGCVAICA